MLLNIYVFFTFRYWLMNNIIIYPFNDDLNQPTIYPHNILPNPCVVPEIIRNIQRYDTVI